MTSEKRTFDGCFTTTEMFMNKIYKHFGELVFTRKIYRCQDYYRNLIMYYSDRIENELRIASFEYMNDKLENYYRYNNNNNINENIYNSLARYMKDNFVSCQKIDDKYTVIYSSNKDIDITLIEKLLNNRISLLKREKIMIERYKLLILIDDDAPVGLINDDYRYQLKIVENIRKNPTDPLLSTKNRR